MPKVFRPPTQIERQQWKELQLRGKAHFIVVRGLVGFGGVMFILFAFFDFFARFYWHTTVKIGLPLFAVQGVIFAIAGALWGASTWRSLERRFRL